MPNLDNTDQESNHISRDEHFLRKVGETVASNLSDEKFGVENLAESMAMSRVQLYRKINKLTGKNISQFIRELRLEKAMELLKEDVASVAEIAYRVGFGSPAYFSKCFHEYCGLTPGEVNKFARQGEGELLDSVSKQKKQKNQNIFFGIHGNPYARRVFFTVNGMILLLVVSFLFYQNFRKGSASSLNRHKTIAVLPFRNESPDPDNEYFCNGMRDEIITKLQKIQDLQVKSRAYSESYRNSDIDILEIAKELDVSYILEGSVRKSGDDLRIYVHLIDGMTGDDLWADSYDGQYNEEIFRFQQETALQIAGALNAVVTPEENRKLSAPPTIDVTAYDYVLRAYDEKWKFWLLNDTVSLKNAERLIDKAVKLDPDYSRGWGEKGANYLDRYGSSKEYFTETYLDSALWYSEKAGRLDPESRISYMLKAMVYHKTGDIKNAIHNYEKVIKIPAEGIFNGQEAMWRLGFIYVYKKDFKRGISLIRKAVLAARESPRHYASTLKWLAHAYLWIGDFQQAEDYYEQSKDMYDYILPYCYYYYYQGDFKAALDCSKHCIPPTDNDLCLYFVGNTYFQLGDTENAVNHYRQFREFREARNRIQGDNLYREGIALIELGMEHEGMNLIEEQLAQLEERKKLGRPDGYDYHLAAIHAYRGDQDKALEYLREYDKKVFYPYFNIIPIYFARHDRLFRSLWNNPEFKALLKQSEAENEKGRAEVRRMEEREELYTGIMN